LGGGRGGKEGREKKEKSNGFFKLSYYPSSKTMEKGKERGGRWGERRILQKMERNREKKRKEKGDFY